MGALEQYVAELFGDKSQKIIAEENPYYNFIPTAQAFSQGAAGATTDGKNPRADLWNKAFASSLGGLLGGGLQGFGTDYQNTLTDRYNSAVLQGLNGQEPSAEGLSPGLFGAAKRGAQLFGALRRAGQIEQEDTADATVDLQEKLIDVEARKRLAQIVAEDRAWKQSAGGGVAPKAGLVVLGKGGGAAPSASGSLTRPVGNPNNPYFQEEVKAVERQQDLAEKIRKEFNALDEVKNFPAVERSAQVLAKAVKDKSAMSDQELVRYAILMIEPGMAVREGEQAAVAASQSLPEAWKGGALKALNGEAALGADARAGILRLAARAYESQRAQYNRALTFYQAQAESQGLDPKGLSRIGEAQSVEEVMGEGGTSKDSPPPPQVGKRRYWNGKSWEYK